jgi:hypothetical protein
MFSSISPEKRSMGEENQAKIFFNETREIFAKAWRAHL